ncbi:hypothetical protein EG861_14160, partial [Enterococcus faecalis]
MTLRESGGGDAGSAVHGGRLLDDIIRARGEDPLSPVPRVYTTLSPAHISHRAPNVDCTPVRATRLRVRRAESRPRPVPQKLLRMRG